MARVGLPANPTNPARLKARRFTAASSSRPRPTSSPTDMAAVALGAIAFRVLSVAVARLSAGLHPHVPTFEGSTFGLSLLLVRTIERVIGGSFASPITPTLIVSWGAFAGAMVLLLRLAQLDVDAERAHVAVLLAAVFPFALVFERSSADALFLMFALGAFYGFRKQHWILGGICGALAAAAIPTGIFIVPALAWIGLRDTAGRRLSVLIGLSLTVAGLLMYLTYLYYLGGPPGGWAVSVARWGFQLTQAPWVPLQRAFMHQPSAPPLALLNYIGAVVAVATIPLVWWRLNGGYAIYMIGMLMVPLTSARDERLGTTCALLFPMFALAASIRWRVAVALIVVASAMLYGLEIAFG